MINLLIEPTSGKILIDGEDITTKDPTQLRRTIGYVIQGGGLMPHMSVADNISLVPKLLKWDQKRIRSRVDELMEMTGLDRKSTRLNSSHVAISYAVFCLKKKKVNV